MKTNRTAQRTNRVHRMISTCIAILLWTLTATRVAAQGVGISETSISPDASAILELRYTSGPYKGLLIPRMTTANRLTIGSPADGLLVYDTDINAFYYYDGGWIGVPGGNEVLGIANGGTGQTTATAAFDALSPLTTLGDVLYGGTAGADTRLAGNTTTARMALTQTGTGAVSAAPAWVPVGHSGVTVLAGSGNYNVPADVTVIVVELVGGGGGGGGGVAANAGTVSAAGGGGGGGAYTRRRIATSGGTVYSYVVGTGGPGAGAGVGTAGGQTQFNTAAITANGGAGGTNMASGTTVTTVAGGAGGTAGATGDVNIPGGAGGRGYRGSGTIAISGTGGGSMYGSNTTCVYAAVSALTNGTAGSLYGSGGSGGAAQRTGGGPFTGTGGNGSNGTIIVWEFK